MTEPGYDSILVLSFGGPERHEDVLPFLENVLRGRNVPRERMLEVAEHYYHFGGKSPINDRNRELIAALQRELACARIELPIYWGNRNWHPLLADTLRKMRDDGRKRAIGYVTSAFSSYSGCRQYLEDIAAAQAEAGPGAPAVDKLRAFYNHPAFIETLVDRAQEAMQQLPSEARGKASLLFTAHSVPLVLAETSDYQRQLLETCRLVADRLERPEWQLVYQSRSGPPAQPWLEPDVNDAIRALHARGVRHIVISPVGFVSCHMEVLYDLDTEARAVCNQLGIGMVRAETPNAHPRFVAMIRELIEERIRGAQPRAIGCHGPRQNVCPADCCPAPPRAVRTVSK